MAKVCPLTGQKVLYLDCLECEDKNKCKNPAENNFESGNVEDVCNYILKIFDRMNKDKDGEN